MKIMDFLDEHFEVILPILCIIWTIILLINTYLIIFYHK